MNRPLVLSLLALAAGAPALAAQQPPVTIRPGVADTSPFRPLARPTPNA